MVLGKIESHSGVGDDFTLKYLASTYYLVPLVLLLDEDQSSVSSNGDGKGGNNMPPKKKGSALTAVFQAAKDKGNKRKL